MNCLDELDKLNLPVEDYAICGSGPLAVRGLRENKDIDIVVRRRLWDELKQKHEIHKGKEGVKIRIGVIDIWPQIYGLDVYTVINHADIISGNRFITLEDTIAWKKKQGRAKDLDDIRLIQEYLKTRQTLEE